MLGYYKFEAIFAQWHFPLNWELMKVRICNNATSLKLITSLLIFEPSSMCSLSLCSWVAQLTHKTYILKKVFEFNGTFPCPKSCLHKKWMTPKSDFGTALETVNEQSQLQVAFEQTFSREAPFLIGFHMVLPWGPKMSLLQKKCQKLDSILGPLGLKPNDLFFSDAIWSWD